VERKPLAESASRRSIGISALPSTSWQRAFQLGFIEKCHPIFQATCAAVLPKARMHPYDGWAAVFIAATDGRPSTAETFLMSTGSLALIILAAVLAQVATLVLVGLYRQRNKYRDIGLPQSGPPVARVAAKLPLATGQGGEGYRDFLVQRRVLDEHNRTVCSFYLVPADGGPLPAYQPGQYLTFRLQIPDLLTGESKTVVRCYSLSDRPRPDYYRVTIKRVPPAADTPSAPPGLASNFFHDQLQQGTRLSVRLPSGHFHLMEESALPIVLVAGGIGITPMLSILNTVLETDSSREVWLFFGVRSSAEHIMKGHLDALHQAHANFHLHVCYSRPGDGDVLGVDYQHRGHADIQLLRATLKLARYQFYVCGPKPMMEILVPALDEWGIAPSDIHYESFGPASLAKREAPTLPTEKIIRVTFSRSGKTVPWGSGTDSLLGLAEANGIDVESGCRAGSCGSCQTPLEAGEVDYSQQPDADIEPGHCLLCVSVPKGDITLHA
jgi:ferredoxin-NADP reductase